MKPAGSGFPSLEHITANPIVGRGEVNTVLALDLSSSCVGWACGVNKRPERYGKFVFKTTAEVGEKLVSFETYLAGMLEVYKPKVLLVERPSRYGKTSERHVELMGITRKVFREKLGLEVLDSWVISPITIKRVMGVKRGTSHKDNKKIMVNKINSLYNLGLKYHENSKYKSDDDTADALALLTTYWRRNAR